MSEKEKKKPRDADERKYPKKGTPKYRKLCEAADRGWPTKIWNEQEEETTS